MANVVVKKNHKDIGLRFWGNKLIELESFDKKENLSSVDIMALRYAAMETISNLSYDLDMEYTRDDIEGSSSICNDSLYVGDFNGYIIRYTENGYYEDKYIRLKSFEMSTDGRVIACIENEETDTLEYYLVY